jgi:hypothetical protein
MVHVSHTTTVSLRGKHFGYLLVGNDNVFDRILLALKSIGIEVRVTREEYLYMKQLARETRTVLVRLRARESNDQNVRNPNNNPKKTVDQ